MGCGYSAPAAAVESPHWVAEALKERRAEDKAKSQRAAQALFEKLGGAGFVSQAVNIFHQKLMADPVVAPFFQHIELATLMRKQVQFMTLAFGGQANYCGLDIAVAHAELIEEHGVNETHFDLVLSHFMETLDELDVDPRHVAESRGVLIELRPIFERPRRKGGAAPRQPLDSGRRPSLDARPRPSLDSRRRPSLDSARARS